MRRYRSGNGRLVCPDAVSDLESIEDWTVTYKNRNVMPGELLAGGEWMNSPIDLTDCLLGCFERVGIWNLLFLL